MRTSTNYIRTYTGRKFWPLDPLPEDVCIEDIAHALSQMCRYGGHSRRFYCTAEHCVRMYRKAVALGLPRLVCYAALMHDATEAYIPDVCRPLKKDERFEPFFDPVEDRVAMAISQRLQVDYPYPEVVHQLDHSILTDEMIELVPFGDYGSPGAWSYGEPLGEEGSSMGWMPTVAERAFLDAFHESKPAGV